MIGAIGSAMTGMASAMARFDRGATKVAQQDAPLRGRVDQMIAQHEFSANLATIRTADDMVGTLINTIA